MFHDKVVLDIGCGAGGKTLYYTSQGVRKIYGLDIVAHYKDEATALAEEKGLRDHFGFVLGDAAETCFNDNFFDAMEHVDQPLKVLNECNRILKPKGKLYINFPPYYHPYGAHLSNAMGCPWIHVLFDDQTLIQVYKDFVHSLPDGQRRVDLRISKNENNQEYFSYINKMTLRRFHKILDQTNFAKYYYDEIPLHRSFRPLTSIPVAKEFFVKMVVCILAKT